MGRIIRLMWIGLMLGSGTVWAADGLTGELGLFYMTDSGVRSLTDNSDQAYTVKTKTNYTFLSLGLCYRLEWFCIGLKYLDGTVEQKTSNSSSGSSGTNTETFSGPGLTLGYSSGEWVAHASMLFGAQKKINDETADRFGGSSSTGTRYPAKSATILDLGYGFKVGNLRLGPLLSILHMEYNQRYSGGQKETLPSKESDDFIMPHFALWMDF